MKFEVIGIHGHRRRLELNNHFHRVTLGPGRKIEKRMLVKGELGEHTLEAAWVRDHDMILTGVTAMCARLIEV
jgi:hypothetical protein